MWFELWDSETGNRVGKYQTEEAALGAVLEDIRLYGRGSEAIVSLGLLRRDPEGQQDSLIAEGDALAERALALVPTSGPNSMATALGRTDHAGS